MEGGGLYLVVVRKRRNRGISLEVLPEATVHVLIRLELDLQDFGWRERPTTALFAHGAHALGLCAQLFMHLSPKPATSSVTLPHPYPCHSRLQNDADAANKGEDGGSEGASRFHVDERVEEHGEAAHIALQLHA